MNKSLRYAVFLSSLMLLVGLGCSKDKVQPGVTVVEEGNVVYEDGPEDGETGAAFFEANNFNDGTLTVKEVFVSHWPAWVVVYENVNGQPGKIVGLRHLESDKAFNFEIQIPEKNPGDRVTVMIHRDTGVEGEFDFPEADAPFNDMEPVNFGLSNPSRF